VLSFRADAAPQTRSFRIESGPNVNDFVQTPALSMHVAVRTTSAPRILFATPAGDSGVGLWFRATGERGLSPEGMATPVTEGTLTGVEISLTGPARLEVERVILDSVRALRDYDHDAIDARETRLRALLALLHSGRGHRAGATPAIIDEVAAWLSPVPIIDRARPGVVVVERRALGSGARYRVELIPREGTTACEHNGRIELTSAAATRFGVRAFIDRPPLSPLEHVLARQGRTDQERNLEMLVFREKLVAGSYQYLTYFGRDSAISTHLLADRMEPAVLGIAVGSILDRVSSDGRVAHEESIGDQATFEALPELMRHIEAGQVRLDPAVLEALERPRYDYKMIDGELLLPPLLADFLSRVGPAEAKKTLTPERLAALGLLTARIVDETEPFARTGRVADLIQLRPGQEVGNWRDSNEGLGHGRTPLDVNAYLVPAALDAFSRLAAIHPELAIRSTEALARRRAVFAHAAERFLVSLGTDEARARAGAYLQTFPAAERTAIGSQRLWSGVTVSDALSGRAAPELDGGVRFPGIALDAAGRPVPVISSDEAFQWFYGTPSRDELVARVRALFQPFPIGLATPVGLVVANPAFSDRPGDHALFDRDHYHGAVVWSWQQTLMRRGLQRQRARFAGDPQVEEVVGRALATLAEIDRRLGTMRASELWSWQITDGRFVAQPFGTSARHQTESTALQLWSNTF
jgi:hypothetical protein